MEKPTIETYTAQDLVDIERVIDASSGSSIFNGFKIDEADLKHRTHGLINPLIPETGLPHLVIIQGPPDKGSNIKKDFHHGNHPEVDYKKGDDADIAVRMSFGQTLPKWLHKHYHNWFSRSEKHTTREQKFIATVLSVAKVVSPFALDFTDDGPISRELTDRERADMLTTVRYEGENKWDKGRYFRNRIGMFFAAYAVEQSVRHIITDNRIDEFLHTRNIRVKQRLGNALLQEAIGISLDPVRPIYEKLRDEGLTVPRIQSLQPVVTKYFTEDRWADYHSTLEERLVAS